MQFIGTLRMKKRRITDYSQCIHCQGKIKGQHATNLKNHMSVKHKNKFDDILIINNTQREQNVSQKRNDDLISEIKTNCVKLVTIHGRPFQLLEDAAFQKIINMVVPTNKFINIQSIKSMIADKSYEIKLKIATELRRKLLCVKLDSATYQDRSFLGINVQYIQNEIVKIRTLAAQEVFERQTGEFLKKTLLDVLNDYQIDASQIYCITTDNGKNFKKMAKLLGGSYEPIDIDQESGQYNTDSETDEEDEDNANDINHEIPIDSLMTALNENENYSRSNFLPRTMLCAAHTLQLAIKDFFESNPDVDNLIFRVRQVVKLLRTPTIRNILKRANLKKPIIDCPTRWSSTYNMLLRMQSLKTVCLNDANIMSRLDESNWQTITDLIDCLKPCFIATLKLQKEQLTLGDFFIEWLTCKGNLEKRRTPISQSLLDCMKTREVNLLNTNVMLEALYLDTRLNVILSDQEAAKARQLLKETLNQINKLKLKDSDSNSDNIMVSSFNSIDEPMAGGSGIQNQNSAVEEANILSYAEEILRSTEQQRGIVQETNSTNVLLREIRNLPRLPIKENIIKYWNSKLSSPEVAELALCVLATPATQVSVERLFSSVKYILSPLRSNLSQTTLANIMVIRSNHDLFM
ncbi:unnamed protein product [Chilo suppressalis]|uniref:HAT C-terminal dimerisation domain-containing protein n=1 Tax=Chilo suppressalis TaxID=168631 RepID=A0ABN8AWD4_CHISP|nr:unnamed protein product [Chilo suppressalis]